MSLGSIYIVCPGPSMRDFPFEKLRNRKTIVVNRSCYYVPNWDIMVFLDEGMLNELSNNKKKSEAPLQYPTITNQKTTIMNKNILSYYFQ
ncbi:MAG: hypothetical protein WCV43_06040 [Candidatus Caldatribacteriota bacterium]